MAIISIQGEFKQFTKKLEGSNRRSAWYALDLFPPLQTTKVHGGYALSSWALFGSSAGGLVLRKELNQCTPPSLTSISLQECFLRH